MRLVLIVIANDSRYCAARITTHRNGHIMEKKSQNSKHIHARKHSASHQLAVTAISSAVLFVSAAAIAAEDQAHDGVLQTVTVEADAIESFKADKLSSPKFTQPLVDTPQTLIVVKKELFQQQSANTLSETLRNTPGITLLMGENGNTATGDSIFMRGFDTQGSIYVDGIRDLGSITRDTFNTEQVEIAKGPAGVDNGRGAASGYVNMSSKMARLEDASTGNLTGGSEDYARGTLDINRRLTDSSALRVNLLKQEAGVVGRDHVESNFEGVAASLGLGLGTATRTHINYLTMKQSGIPDGGLPTIGLKGYYSSVIASRFPDGDAPIVNTVNSENFYGSKTDHNDVNANMFTVRIEHDLAEGVTLRNTSRYGRTNQDQVLTGVGNLTIPTDASKYDVNTWSVSRSRQGKDVTNQILTNQTNIVASFNAAGIQHDLSGGVEFISERQVSRGVGLPYIAHNSATTLTQVGANLYNPNLNDVFQPVLRNGTKTEGETTTYGVYVLDTMTFNPQWELSVGLRADRFHTDTTQITRQGNATPQTIAVGTYLANEASLTDELFSWKIGGVFKPTDKGSIYISYATSEQPPGGANFALNTSNAANNINSPNMDPQKGTNIEVGTKWNLFDDRLFFTAAVFKSTNENEISTEVDGTSTQRGERKVEGVELGLVGGITQAWQVSAGLAVMDTEIVRGNRSAANNGASNNEGGDIQWSPKLTFTLWNSYTFNNGLVLGGGARYVDNMVSSSLTNSDSQATRSIYEFGDYWVIDAMASYPITSTASIQLNLMNIADEEYIGSLNNAGNRYYAGQPFSARVGVNVSF